MPHVTRILCASALCAAVLSSLASAQWSTLPVPSPHFVPVGTRVGTEVFIAGGSTAFLTDTREIDIHDVATGAWRRAQMSRARQVAAAVSVRGVALFAGGTEGSSWSRRVDLVDPSGVVTSHDLSNYGTLAGAAVGDKALLAGGFVGSSVGSAASAAVAVYDASAGTWSQASLSIPRGSPAAATVGTKVLFAGGLGPAGLTNRVDIYDDATGLWTTAALSVERAEAAAAVVGSKVLLCGGFSGGPGAGHTDVVDVYDDATGTWSTARLSVARSQAVAATVGPLVLVAGGTTGLNIYSDVVDVYDSRSGQWSVTALSTPRARPAVVAVCNTVVVAGGDLALPATNSVADVFTFLEGVGQRSCAPSVVNSSGTSGLLCAHGTASAVGGAVTLRAFDLARGSVGVFLCAPSTGMVVGFGSGVGTLCLGGGLGVLRGAGGGIATGAAGALERTLDPALVPTPTGTTAIQPGETWHFQCWFRDASSGVSTTNLTDALSIPFS